MGKEGDEDASIQMPSLLTLWQLSLEAASLLPELEPRPSVMAKQKGKPNNQTPAMAQTISIGKRKKREHKTNIEKATQLTGDLTIW